MDVDSLLPKPSSGDVNFFVVFGIAISFLLIGFVFPGMLIVYSIITTRIFSATINKKLFPKIFNYMDLDAKHIAADEKFVGVELPPFWKMAWTEKSEQLRVDSFQYEQVASQLKHSELITVPRNGMSVDDIISIKLGGSTLLVAELNVININRNSIRSIKKYFMDTLFHLIFHLHCNTKRLFQPMEIRMVLDMWVFGIN